MSGRLLISALPGEMRVLRLDAAGALTQVRVLRADRPGRRGERYLGRVSAVDRALGAAFVEIGLARPGLLPLPKAGPVLSEGASLGVRVTRAPAPDKGAKLALDPALAVPEGARAPLRLTEGDDPIAALLAEADPPEEILVDDPALFRAAERRLAARPALAARLRLHAGPGALLDETLTAEVEALLEPRVDLAGGAHLLVEPVRTLTAIDVNSGERGTGEALAIDLAAAAEIARQLRLRELSGLIVVDFLELARRDQRAAVTAALQAATADDPEPVQVQPMRASGLVEMTRRRSRPPLHELLAERCGIDGGGWRREPVSLAFDLLRRAGAAPPAAALELRVSPRIGAALAGPAAEALAALAQRRGRAPKVTREPARADTAGEVVIA